MAKLIRADNIGTGWMVLLKELLLGGQSSSPRGYGTREILNVTLEITNGLDNILVDYVRNVNHKFMIAEWLWVQAGLEEVSILASYNSVMKNFSDDGEILSGAYGPRLLPQIPYIIRSLKKPDSRQAVATIWTPSPNDSRDIPCTISLQWLVRSEKLHCTVNMRSSDVWLGIPYDFFTFSQITNYISSRVGVPVGSVTMNLASSHLYESNTQEATKSMVMDASSYLSSPAIPTDVYFPTSQELKALLNGEVTNIRELDPFWSSYGVALNGSRIQALEVLRELNEAI